MLHPDLKILIIDDNPEIHKDFIKILSYTENQNNIDILDTMEKDIFGESAQNQKNPLQFPKFTIDTASQGQEGLELIKKAKKENNPYSLAFVDIRMPPGWDGIETIKHIWEVDKNIQIVICTAYSDYSWEKTVEELGQTDNLLILKKPFDNIAVRQLACALTRKWQLLLQTQAHHLSLEEKIKERTQALETSLSLTRATLESSNDGIVVINNAGEIVDFNSRFTNMWKIPSVIMETKNIHLLTEYLLTQVEDQDAFLKMLNHMTASTEGANIDDVQCRDGSIFECYSQPYRMNHSTIGRVWSYRDITKRVKLEKKLLYQVTHDELTNLLNRTCITEHIYQLISETQTQQFSFAVFFLDMDRFKLINDSLGHAAGDTLIREFATRLSQITDGDHIAARLGGDEFIIVVKKKEENDFLNFASELLNISQESFQIGEKSIGMTLSIGISVFPEHGKTADELLKRADAAMYLAKERGGNQFCFYTKNLDHQALERLEKETELRNAIKKKELFLCYQPEFNIASGSLVAVEALVRWKHPTKGIILPLDFIPLAEETGLIIPLGEWVLRTACQQAKKWQENGLPPISVAVNVTAPQFRLSEFPETVSKILKESGLLPHFLKIEVTENTLISDPIVSQAIGRLKTLGIQIVLDDFGTGYTSLHYLKKIPLDGLKIDQSFVHNINLNHSDEVILRAIVAMAHSLNMSVLAEGVETNHQLDFLKQHHCEEVQGFYFATPLLPSELETILRNQCSKEKIKNTE